LIENPLLMVLDSGNDSKTLLQEMLYAEDVSFVIKRKLRTESVQEWVETAKANPEHEREARASRIMRS
jgi:hypothetical protein